MQLYSVIIEGRAIYVEMIWPSVERKRNNDILMKNDLLCIVRKCEGKWRKRSVTIILMTIVKEEKSWWLWRKPIIRGGRRVCKYDTNDDEQRVYAILFNAIILLWYCPDMTGNTIYQYMKNMKMKKEGRPELLVEGGKYIMLIFFCICAYMW